MRYFGFDGYEELISRFDISSTDKDIPSDEEILFASYGRGSYEGDAMVIFAKDGGLYEVRASHCSCYGLEGQWQPWSVTWAALVLRLNSKSWDDTVLYRSHDLGAADYFTKMVRLFSEK